jgi:DnaJ-class molecular chaperone with C-terminal Zn finger domain
MVRRKGNPYEILGVTPGVSAADIKKAYRELVKAYHPDLEYKQQTELQRRQSKERMQSINEAYATLIDSVKRGQYDSTIVARARAAESTKRAQERAKKTRDEELQREKFLAKIFHPSRRAVVNVLNQYPKSLTKLEQDIYDDDLVSEFGEYVDKLEDTLVKVSGSFADHPAPSSLEPSVRWMRQSLAQAADGLEELRYFCGNYDYDHLSMARNLFNIAIEHTKLASRLAKNA